MNLLNKIVITAVILVGAAFAQTISLPARVAINAGQCISFSGGFAVPCNNINPSGPAVALGVALNTVPAAAPRMHTTVVVQYSGLVTVPILALGGSAVYQSGDLVGDIDGTGDLSDLGVPVLGPVTTTLTGFPGWTYVGTVLSYNAGYVTILVQPGYIPATI